MKGEVFMGAKFKAALTAILAAASVAVLAGLAVLMGAIWIALHAVR